MHKPIRKRMTRALIVAAVVALATGLTLVFAMTSGSSHASKGHMFASKLAAQEVVGNRGEPDQSPLGEGPSSAAAQDYANQAYPANTIPLQLTLHAQSAWAGVKSRGAARGPSRASQWSLAGPSHADFPGVLTFSGADYTTSGRITALAIDPSCSESRCRVWAAAAGGGIWRTDNALSGNGAGWTYISGALPTNAIGTLLYQGGVLYAGTGEPNASVDSEAGLGLFKSTDGGNTWTHLAALTSVPADTVDCTAAVGSGGIQTAPAYNGPAFDGRSISSVVVRGGTMYVASARGVRGVSSVLSGGVVSLAPGLPPYGLWKSTDGGATFTLLNASAICLNPTLPNQAGIIQSSFGSTRGVTKVALDPGDPGNTVYASAFPQNNRAPINTNGGVWRSSDDGASWTQIKTALNPTLNTDRTEFSVTGLSDGNTRMYVGDGTSSDSGASRARFYRTDDARAAAPVFTDMTTSQNIGYCTSQCWYDNVVYSPPGQPDVVYLGGAYSYGTYGATTNGRAFIRSADAGASFTDMTWDATTNPTPPGSCCQSNPVAPNGQHPDSHAIVAIPGTDSAIFGGDGGLTRSSGSYADISSQCTDYRGLTGANLALCQQLLSSVPTYLYNMNKGLSTLQFQSLAVAADNPKHLQGGTQDNGTFETTGSTVVWPQIVYGDGGQSGFNVSNSALRFNSFTGAFHDANFQNGDPTKWVIISGPIAATEPAQFYAPIIADPNPATAGSIFEGAVSVWRTQDWGGDQAYLEANCPEFTTSGTNTACGDFVQIGPAGSTNLTANGGFRGTGRGGGNVAAVERTASDTGTLWAATTTGRVFITKNANAADQTSVTFARLDDKASATTSPGRFVSGIAIDPANPNHAWISYSSYSSLTPTTPGHVFSVTFNGNMASPDATWTSLDGSGATAFPDFPATDVAFDDVTGDLYASTDFGVLRKASGSSDWTMAAVGLPQVEVAGLTIVPSARKLYAATHGRSAWQLTLP
jgi:hypothetical protein